MRPLVCSFFTDDFYRKYAVRLRKSACAMQWPHHILPLPDRGGWVKNCGQKAAFMNAVMSIPSSRPLLWIDADGEITREPRLFLQMSADFAIRAEPGRHTKKPTGREVQRLPENWPEDVTPRWFNSGTIFVNRTDKGKALLRRWVELTEEKPSSWDQWTLQQAWADVQPTTVWLPQSYCKIATMGWRSGEGPHTYIRHELASTKRRVSRK